MRVVPEISVVVPVFDEAPNLATLLAELEVTLARVGRPFEILLVNDGSTDDSLGEMKRLAESHAALRIFDHGRNLGQSAALVTGFRAARGAVVVTLDADLQNDPADIPRLLAALAEHRAVSGVRVDRHDSWLRRVASRVANVVRSRTLSDQVTDVGCSLKAYRAPVLRDLPAFDGMHRFLPALLQARGVRFHEIPVRHRARRNGRSKYGINDRLWRGLVDLIGVRWLTARSIDAGLAREIDVWLPRRSGTRSASPARLSSSLDSSSSGSRPKGAARASSRMHSGS